MSLILIGESHISHIDNQMIPQTLPSYVKERPLSHLYSERLPPLFSADLCKPDCKKIMLLALKGLLEDITKWGLKLPNNIDGIGSIYLHSFLPNGPKNRLVSNLTSLKDLSELEKKMIKLLPPDTIHSPADVLRLVNDERYLHLLSQIMLSYLKPTNGNTAVIVGAYHIKDFLKARDDIKAVYGIYASYSVLDYLYKQGLPNDTPAQILAGNVYLLEAVVKHLPTALSNEISVPYNVYVFFPEVETPTNTRGFVLGPFQSFR